MNSSEDGIPIAKVDATIEKDLAEQFQIQGFPSLKLFLNGEPVEYNGERTKEAISTWLQSKSEGSVKQLNTLADLEEFQKQNLAVLLSLDESETSTLKKFQTFALNYEDVPFAFTHSQELKEKLEIN